MDPQTPPEKPSRRKRDTPAAYETPTPKKVAMGIRMRKAREAACLSATQAAASMGYAQAVQISQMETGKRPVTMEVLEQAARLYGTTADYLLGLSEDVDRDPAVAVAAVIHRRNLAELERITNMMSALSVEVARKLLPDASRGHRLAQMALETSAALRTFVALNPTFESRMRGGAQLAAKVQAGADAAAQYVAHIDRARRAMHYTTLSEVSGRPETGSLLPIFEAIAAGEVNHG